MGHSENCVQREIYSNICLRFKKRKRNLPDQSFHTLRNQKKKKKKNKLSPKLAEERINTDYRKKRKKEQKNNTINKTKIWLF